MKTGRRFRERRGALGVSALSETGPNHFLHARAWVRLVAGNLADDLFDARMESGALEASASRREQRSGFPR